MTDGHPGPGAARPADPMPVPPAPSAPPAPDAPAAPQVSTAPEHPQTAAVAQGPTDQGGAAGGAEPRQRLHPLSPVLQGRSPCSW